MPTGAKSGQMGGSVPLQGESEIRQASTAADLLTITGASGVGGNLLVVRSWVIPGSTLPDADAIRVNASGQTRIAKVVTANIGGAGATAVTLGASQSGMFLYGEWTSGANVTMPAPADGLIYNFFFTGGGASTVLGFRCATTGSFLVANDSGGADGVVFGSTLAMTNAAVTLWSNGSNWFVIGVPNGSSVGGGSTVIGSGWMQASS